MHTIVFLVLDQRIFQIGINMGLEELIFRGGKIVCEHFRPGKTKQRHKSETNI